MSVLQQPAAGVIMLLEYSIGGTVYFRWATQAFNDNGYTSPGSFFYWEPRILQMDKLVRGAGNQHQFQKAQIRITLANTDGALTPIVRDINDATKSYYMAQIKLSIVAYDPVSGPAINEIKTLGIYRVDSIDNSDIRSHLQLTLADKSELVFGYLKSSPTLYDAWIALVAADADATLDSAYQDNQKHTPCPFAFGQETVPGIRMTDLGTFARGANPNFDKTLGGAFHWLFFVAAVPGIGSLVKPTRELLTYPGGTSLDASGSVGATPWHQVGTLYPLLDVSNVATGGDTPAPLFTVRLTLVTVAGVQWYVCWGVANSRDFHNSIGGFVGGTAGGTVQWANKFPEVTSIYVAFDVFVQPDPQNGETLSGSNSYGYDGYDTIRSIVDGYTEGSIANVDATSFSKARTSRQFSLPAGGVISPHIVTDASQPPQGADQFIEQIMQSHQIDCFWEWSGKLGAIGIGNPTVVQDADHTYTDADIFQAHELVPRPEERGGLCTRIEITGTKPWHNYVPKSIDLAVAANTKLSSAGFAVGTLLETVYGRRITRRVDGSWHLVENLLNNLMVCAGETLGYEFRRIVFTTGLRALRMEIGDWIRLTWKGGLDTGGYSQRLCQVFGLTLDHENKTVEVDCLLMDQYDSGIAFKPFLLDDRNNGSWIRTQAGNISISANSTTAIGIGTTFSTDGVQAGDVLVIVSGPNVLNAFTTVGPIIGATFRTAKVSSVTDNTHLILAQSVCSRSLGNNTVGGNVGYRIERSDVTQASRSAYGRLALRLPEPAHLSSGQPGYRIYN